MNTLINYIGASLLSLGIIGFLTKPANDSLQPHVDQYVKNNVRNIIDTYPKEHQETISTLYFAVLTADSYALYINNYGLFKVGKINSARTGKRFFTFVGVFGMWFNWYNPLGQINELLNQKKNL